MLYINRCNGYPWKELILPEGKTLKQYLQYILEMDAGMDNDSGYVSVFEIDDDGVRIYAVGCYMNLEHWDDDGEKYINWGELAEFEIGTIDELSSDYKKLVSRNPVDPRRNNIEIKSPYVEYNLFDEFDKLGINYRYTKERTNEVE